MSVSGLRCESSSELCKFNVDSGKEVVIDNNINWTKVGSIIYLFDNELTKRERGAIRDYISRGA